jgi:tetratricopeptide (TPR) repeat protein
MALLTTYSDKKLLILDDLPEMRTSLRSQSGTLGFEKIVMCGTVRDAIEAISQTKFDIIICDYYLGAGTDGQQFLEYLRSRNLISRSTLFVMVTAEKGYESVVTAAECLPDEYLLKPFTAESFKTRVERLLTKKEKLAKIDALQDAEKWTEVVRECDYIIADRDRYLVDAMRIKGNALLHAGQYAEAAKFYEEVLALRPLPWARLGLAKAKKGLGAASEARELLDALIVDAPQLMAAYDLLGQVHSDLGDSASAIAVLDDASRISPNSLSRQRAIAVAAETAGDFQRVEQAMSEVVRKTRNSPLRESGDFARLGHAYSAQGHADKALEVISEGQAVFKDQPGDPLLLAVEAIVQHQLGDAEKAEQALQRALEADLSALPANASLTLAKACLANGKVEDGEAILKHVVQSEPDAKAVHARVTQVMSDHGIAERAPGLVEESVQEVIRLNNEAVRCGKEGRIGDAAAMLQAAAKRLPGNAQIVANAAYALLLDVFANGFDEAKLADARSFEIALRHQEPGHRKLAEIDTAWTRVCGKYPDAKRS